ncbi:polymorphic toxin-type HINT domain-containing protein [Mycolicibacterium sp. 120266]|uniref:polymorphic toxin-type HINT domain-containing protein n=1 Tax=Mycolicibacterium sp. 120266 TaxID=3090601 RepID=UPI00299D3012|nr:polymorphic toxin-type HINT domain-containing protein [Mycolicibacterium sp. 120266]MDX1870586.1 polymorphic toxin-type HINT domain-containing protein [Mycolicibacterium sp. 120266]
MGDFLPGDRPWWAVRRWWPVAVALVVTVALTVAGQHWLTDYGRSETGRASVASPAQRFADAALAAFTGSTTIAIPASALTPAQRSSGLPTDPVAGLTSTTPAGPVQVVLPGGLGAAQHTTAGQVVYPDTGAGFDMLAENTGTGTRTVARITSPAGVRMVTTFVRTPADTVMLAHTNGFLTINRATPTAETVGMFAPAETRDAAGKLVPSSYVTRQLRPGLYQLSEVIDPRPDTVWPVYLDPPLHVGDPLPVGLFDSFTSTISSAASAVGSAVSTAASATVSGAQAVGTFVKNNPMETAIIVAGAAVAVTGVGGPAGAAAIAAAVANVSAAGLQIASEAMPDNKALGVASTLADAATMFTPTGAAKKIAEETAEVVAEQALKHTDDIIDAAKVVPNPTHVRDEITAAGAAGKPPVPGVQTPKVPNAPPAVKTPEPPTTPLTQRVPCAGQSFSPDTLVLLADGTKRPIAALQVGDRVWSTDPDTGQTSGQPVQAVLVNHDTDLLDLTITNPADVTSLVHTTAKHPFYSPTHTQTRPADSAVTGLANTTGTATAPGAGWVDAQDLHPGDQLATPFYDSVAHVANHTPVAGTADMWDLTITTTHTFYISTPTANVLVHNCPMSAPKGAEGPAPTVRPGNIPLSERVPPASPTQRALAGQRNAARNDDNAVHCLYCDKVTEGQTEHIVPRAKGGTNADVNLDRACASCNLSKRDQPVMDWLQRKGMQPSSQSMRVIRGAIRYAQRRPSSPADQRQEQQQRVQDVTETQRTRAADSARQLDKQGTRGSSDHESGHSDHKTGEKKKPRRKSKQHHSHP